MIHFSHLFEFLDLGCLVSNPSIVQISFILLFLVGDRQLYTINWFFETRVGSHFENNYVFLSPSLFLTFLFLTTFILTFIHSFVLSFCLSFLDSCIVLSVDALTRFDVALTRWLKELVNK